MSNEFIGQCKLLIDLVLLTVNPRTYRLASIVMAFSKEEERVRKRIIFLWESSPIDNSSLLKEYLDYYISRLKIFNTDVCCELTKTKSRRGENIIPLIMKESLKVLEDLKIIVHGTIAINLSNTEEILRTLESCNNYMVALEELKLASKDRDLINNIQDLKTLIQKRKLELLIIDHKEFLSTSINKIIAENGSTDIQTKNDNLKEKYISIMQTSVNKLNFDVQKEGLEELYKDSDFDIQLQEAYDMLKYLLSLDSADVELN